MVREHGVGNASGSIVRQLPSFKHPAGSHLRLLGEVAGAGYAEPYGTAGQAHRPVAVSAAPQGSQLSPYLRARRASFPRV